MSMETGVQLRGDASDPQGVDRDVRSVADANTRATEVRGFAPIGMLEFWNIGIMGSGFRLGKDNTMADLK